MSEQQSEIDTLKEEIANMDRRTQRRAEKEAWRVERRKLRHNSPLSGWIGGGTLIIVGLAFLARNVLGWELTNNWWAIFMLIPALSALTMAWRFSKSDQPHLRRAAFGPLVGGGFMLIIAVALFFDVSLQLVWPLLLIVIGLSFILKRGSFSTTPSKFS